MRALAFAALLVLAAGRAEAHAMPNSTVVVAETPAGVSATVSIPLSELEAALGGRLALADRAPLEAYLRAHVAVTGEAGQPWPMTFERVAVDDSEHPALTLTLGFARPAGAGTGATLRYDAVTHRVASHHVLVYRREGAALRPIGRLQLPAIALPIGR